MARELATLVEIDFLPAAYRERSMHRRAYAWRVAAALAIACFFAVTSLWQHNHHAHVRGRLDAVEDEFTDAARRTADLAEVSARLAAAEKNAELLTFLRHRWPRTQIFVAILEPLPAEITLADWHIGYETRKNIRTPVVALPEGEEPPPDNTDRWANDLKRLLHEAATQEYFVTLSGEAVDAVTLHEYLARLRGNRMFARVELVSLENLSADDSAIGSVRFAVRAVLSEGHGQSVPRQPTSPAATAGEAPLARRGG